MDVFHGVFIVLPSEDVHLEFITIFANVENTTVSLFFNEIKSLLGFLNSLSSISLALVSPIRLFLTHPSLMLSFAVTLI